VLVVLLLLAGR